jgi:hypothetical protein
MSKPRKAIGIIRVSHVGGRGGDSYLSPDEQRERIESECKREGFKLIRVMDEIERAKQRGCRERR